MEIAISFVAALVLAAPVSGIVMNRCSLARAMYCLDVPKDQLARWTCIAEHESSFRTNVTSRTNTNGSNDYGIFQINSKYWCQPPDERFSYNECKLSCTALLTDDISNSVTCARQILRQQGWTAWATWKYCNGTLPSIDDCFSA
ncbi:lysozyme 1-like [Anastrepha obliqua]|uniref:lysozyme 1-like n=1 Tax=Anastrepha obliqua TaxID=95512 RepID=UPI00240A4119|nr:lysozyme 1-like [Anastrepha obliqua]XP_054741316.1 lysozyme 1-like [Anastrepha obliqua]